MRGGLVALACAGLLASCASQQEYDQALDLAKQYEREKYELAEENARLLQANEALLARQRSGEIGVLESDWGGDLRDRLNELQQKVYTLDRPLKEIEKFNVEGGYVVMIQDRLLFESGKAELGSEGSEALADIARQISAKQHGLVWVRGHTDSDPVKKPETVKRFPHGNIQLSAERAVAVAALLVKTNRIAEKEIRIVGFGPHEPLKPNSSAANKRLNRRVEIFVEDR